MRGLLVVLAACGGSRAPSPVASPPVDAAVAAPMDLDAGQIDADRDAPVDAEPVTLGPDAAPAPVVKTPPPATPKADIAPLDASGPAPALAPVKGKALTIFEFGATWCAPCKVLEPKLAALAKQYPRIVAIRRLDVSDPDNAATAAYLEPGNFSLPHLKVKTSSGTLVLERSGDAGLDAAVRKLVEQAAK